MSQKHPGGRPTKYKKEYCQQIVDYFTKDPQEITTKKEYYNNGELKSETPIIMPVQFPTFQGFAGEIGVHTDTLQEWKAKYKEFSVAYARAQELQEKIWLINAMSGQYNAQFAQFFGKNCLGYKDKTELEHSQDKPFEVNIKVDD